MDQGWPQDQTRFKRVEKLSLEWRRKIVTWMAKAYGHRRIDFGEVFISSLPVRNKTSALQKLEIFKNPMGTVKDLPYPHTKQGTDEAKNTDRTPLKMSATVASMDY